MSCEAVQSQLDNSKRRAGFHKYTSRILPGRQVAQDTKQCHISTVVVHYAFGLQFVAGRSILMVADAWMMMMEALDLDTDVMAVPRSRYLGLRIGHCGFQS